MAVAVKNLRSWTDTFTTAVAMESAKTCFHGVGRFKFLEGVLDVKEFSESLLGAACSSSAAAATAVGRLVTGRLRAMDFAPTKWAEN
eukprot:5907530-Pyramimonas_sp.AAC.1